MTVAIDLDGFGDPSLCAGGTTSTLGVTSASCSFILPGVATSSDKFKLLMGETGGANDLPNIP